MKKTIFRLAVSLLVAVLSLSGCGLMEIKRQTEVLNQTGTVQGVIHRITQTNGHLTVLVFELKDEQVLLEAAIAADDHGKYHFHATPGTYQIVAFVDHNNDGQYEPDDEPAAYPADTPFITVNNRQNVNAPPISITDEPLTLEHYDSSQTYQSKAYKDIGRVVDLADPMFTHENNSLGMWKPLDFYDNIGGGLFMLQPYERNKLPVLFIHGINGGPDNWKTVIGQLDRSKFQPWIYYYPSGFQLDILSNYLVDAVHKMYQLHRFKRINIVAHSMGGLVARSFVKKFTQRYPSKKNLINLVLTVSSPMNGMSSARTGVEFSPIVIPSWRDVATGSHFIAGLFKWSWPKTIPYYLVFSYEPGEGSDGVVPLESQLPYQLQLEARHMYGFVDTHTSILTDERFIRLLDSLMVESLGKSAIKSGTDVYVLTERK